MAVQSDSRFSAVNAAPPHPTGLNSVDEAGNATYPPGLKSTYLMATLISLSQPFFGGVCCHLSLSIIIIMIMVIIILLIWDKALRVAYGQNPRKENIKCN